MKNVATLLLSLSLSFVLVACGSSSSTGTESGSEASTGGEGEHHGHHGGGGEHHAAMPPALDALHEELAPVWHMEPGAGRATAACEHAESFRTHSASVSAEGTPDGADAELWTASVAQLSSTSEALAASCAAGGADAEAELSRFHDAFHGAMEAAGGHHH